MADAIPEQLVTYLADQNAQRAKAVDDFLTKLTPRERALVTQAAVMGYVQGVRHPEGERIPKNQPLLAKALYPLLAEVVDACFAFPDLYPAINAVARYTLDVQESLQYVIECQQPDGSWVQACGARDDLASANEQLARQREHRPEYTFRVTERQTSVVVYALPEPAEDGESQ